MPQASFKDSFTKVFRKNAYDNIDPTRPILSASGKTVVITGGHSGIGYAIATNFAAAGAAHVVLLGRRREVLEEAGIDLSMADPSTGFHTFPVSIIDEAAIRATFQDIRQQIGEPDILVTSAAYFADAADVLQTPMHQMWASFETNVKGTLNVVNNFLDLSPDPSKSPTEAQGQAEVKGSVAATSTIPSNKNQKRDKIILDVSTAVTHVFLPKNGAYAASKLAFSKLMATAQTDALVPSSSQLYGSLRIHSFHPGMILTQAVRDHGHDEKTAPWDDVQLPGQFAVWLASPEAEFLKGRFVWANWDVEELMERKEEILEDNLLKLGLVGEAEWKV